MNAVKSAIYSGQITHQRHVEKSHKFNYKIFMLYLDIDEMAQGAYSFISRRKFSFVSFRPEDYLKSEEGSTLRERVTKVIKSRFDCDFRGSIRLLAHARCFGFTMNPLAMYYLFDEYNVLKYMIGEITNTPWEERHCYAFKIENNAPRMHDFKFKKDFHVSPFLPMNMDYEWSLSPPESRLRISIWNRQEGKNQFEAHLALHQHEMNRRNLYIHLIKYPWITMKVLLGIYWNAFLLFCIRRVTFYSHPKNSVSVEIQSMPKANGGPIP